jgi:hypothetical protein
MEATNLKQRTNEILKNNGLDFEIIKLPMFGKLEKTFINEGGELITGVDDIKTDYFGLYNSKSGNIINTVKEGYTISQNAEVVEMVLMGAEKFGELNVNKAFSINDGRKVLIQLEVNGISNINGKADIKKYINIIDSNDGSSGLAVSFGSLTLSCQNQFYKFYKSAESRFRHTATIEQRIKELPYLIEETLKQSFKMIEKYNTFASTPLTEKLTNDLVKTLLGFDRRLSVKEESELTTRNLNIMNGLYDHIRKETAEKGNNLWGLKSGVTSYTTHEKSVPKRENGRIESLLTGSGYKMNNDAFDFINAYAMAL